MPSQEKRKFTRVPFDTMVKMTVGSRTIVSRQVRDVSLGGIFVFSEEFFPEGTTCDLDIELRGPVSLLCIHAKGELTRAQEKGMAFKFVDMDVDGLIHLRHLIRIYSRDPEVVDVEYSQNLLGIESVE
jgi:hypothetical protein